MKTLDAIVSRLRNPRSRSLRASVLLLAGAAVLSAVAATHHRTPRTTAPVDDAPATPVAGIDYRMRLDLQRGRVQFFGNDARLDAIAPANARGCHADVAALAPGLWLAVVETGADGRSDLVLQPVGAATPERATALGVRACGEAGDAHAVVLPASLRARMLEQGGVLFVDGDNAQNARDASLAQKGP